MAQKELWSTAGKECWNTEERYRQKRERLKEEAKQEESKSGQERLREKVKVLTSKEGVESGFPVIPRGPQFLG